MKKLLLLLLFIILLSGCSEYYECTNSKTVNLDIVCKDGRSGCTYIYTLEDGSIFTGDGIEKIIDGKVCNVYLGK